jgi:hypothetical protein
MIGCARERASTSLSGIALVLAVAAAVALVVPTGGFSSVQADRGVEIAVAPDSSAYVGYAAECTNDTLAVTVTNRFDHGTEGGSVTVGTATESLPGIDPAGSHTVEFEDGFDADDAVRVVVEGEGVTVRLQRSVPCAD